jgi:pimeloyl-ACP methyl ester carboxylesterase
MRLIALAVLAVLTSGCAPALDALVGGDLVIVGPEAPVVGTEVTYALLGSATQGLTNLRWEVNGRSQATSEPVVQVRFERTGIATITVRGDGPDGGRLAFTQVTVTLPSRPAGTPDVIVFAFSGRCGFPCHPDFNRDRWELAHRWTLDQALASAGANVSVDFRTYRAHVYDRAGFGRGFLSALEDLDHAQRTLVDGVANPTRLVLVGHSHGTQFAHLLAHERPQARFAASVLLDSVCLSWDADHAATFVQALRTPPGTRPGSGPFEIACKNQLVPGRGYLDIGDTVPHNVDRSFEVRSGGTEFIGPSGLVLDATPNGRRDGTQRGVEHLEVPWEDHVEVATAASFGYLSAVQWLANVLSAP